MKDFTKKVIETISEIPPGRVASYGQIASIAGNPRAARQVGRILHSMSAKHSLPWHRVVNAKGEVVHFKADRQRELLIKEGVEIDVHGRIKMEQFRWMGPADEDWIRG
ncbi:MGMT family protein [Siminovitchia sediminis]|uniref:MGMT family protein n=1 Tax=Siminovitchia sediminis TaxID=1274353 RepID=A0ABW4KLI9_9BACI